MFVKENFLSSNIANKNSELMDTYFTLNKKLDNFMDYLDIELCMNKTSSLIHQIAHKAPLDADRFRDYNALYNYRTKYNSIEGQFKNFSSIVEGIEEILDYIYEMTNILYDAKVLANEEDNQDYLEFILKEIKEIRYYKQIFILFLDKVKTSLELGNTLQDIDYHIEDYLIGI